MVKGVRELVAAADRITSAEFVRPPPTTTAIKKSAHARSPFSGFCWAVLVVCTS
jgi:hypothetical protein